MLLREDCPIIYLDTPWTRESVQNDPNYFYLFTDNLNRTSGHNKLVDETYYKFLYTSRYDTRTLCYPNKTQAVIRGLINAYPITTMKDQYGHQLDDSMYDKMKANWISELKYLCWNCNSDLKIKGIKCSNTRFGKGTYSDLEFFAPRLNSLLNKLLFDFIGLDNLKLK